MATKAAAVVARGLACPLRAGYTPFRTAFASSLLRRPYSADAPAAPPPLLAKLKGDLKTAMRAKDAPRLSVLRLVLAEVLNASKTDRPIQTDAQLVHLLRKTEAASQAAVEDFRTAKRQDLVDKEEQQVGVLQEYIRSSGLEVLGKEDLREMVRLTLGDLATDQVPHRSQLGEAVKRLLAPGGPLDGKDFSKPELVELVKEQLNAAKT